MANNQVQVGQSNQPTTLKGLMESPNVKNRFNEILGKKAPGFISSVISVSNQSKLVKAVPNTIVSAAAVAATLDLPIDPNLQFAAIVPYEDRKTGIVTAQFQMMTKGFVQLAQRSGQFKTINVTDVREGEIIEEDLLSGEIKFKKLPADKRNDAKVVGYAGFFRLLNGFEKTFYMTKEQCDAHGRAYSSSYKYDVSYGKKTSLWSTNFDAMAKKTVLKLLLAKYAPLSIEMQTMQQALKFDQAVINSNDDNAADIQDVQFTYVDNQPDAEEKKSPAEMAQARAAAMQAASAQFNKESNNKSEAQEINFEE